MPADDVSLTSKVRAVEAGGHVVAIHFVGESAAIATGEGEVLVAGGNEALIKAHQGVILAAAGDGSRIFTAGDDGKLVATDIDGKQEVLAACGGKWIDQVALGPSGTIAWSSGKTAFVRTNKGERSLEVSSTVGGLAFAPKGLRLAIAHYNGATLWFPNADAKPETLTWKGSHLGVLFSPDGRFLITTMQEPALHGWRLSDGQHMRMSGYPARVRSFGFSADGDWLATSGAQEVILWPFRTRDGPMGKEPLMLAPGPEDARVSAVAGHPQQAVLAVGYSDGMVILARLEDAAEVLVSRPGGAPVTALAWRGDGRQLAFGTEAGKAGLLAL
ncbi:MAG TPA: WD40 repeat domain-containing protein [Xanthobacteraceae bacterium]|nr:WD40 repeat domain-containing protein [Xanthobacteraceae bacterium]